MFVVSSFWGLVCIVYLFVALEKLVYFIVRTPHAVLDKLQFTVDATEQCCSEDYFREIMSKIDKMQTYSSASAIEELEEQAGISWFFMIAFDKPNGFKISQAKCQSSITRTLSSALRRFTLDNNENLVVRFFQIASNTDIEYNIDALTSY